MARIMVCDDRPQVRDRMSHLMSQVPGVVHVDGPSGSRDIVSCYSSCLPGVVLFCADVDGGATAVRALLHREPHAVVLVFGDGDNYDHLTGAMAAGARGFLRWDASGLEVSAALAHTLPIRPPGRPAAPNRNNGHSTGPTLTERELQVLRGISEGKTNVEIGRSLFLSEDTVKTHARRLFRKLGVHHRAEAVARALRDGLIR
ncbi:MAG: response regulator transcription factor [Mycobacteriales bacterium]